MSQKEPRTRTLHRPSMHSTDMWHNIMNMVMRLTAAVGNTDKLATCNLREGGRRQIK